MKGYVQLDADDYGVGVKFAFNVPVPKKPDRLDFAVQTVGSWDQRAQPKLNTLIGMTDNGGWVAALAGVSYQQVGMYLGRDLVLVVASEGGE